MNSKHKMKFRNPYDFRRFEGIKCGPGKTQTHHKEDVDINNIMNRYMRTGELPERTSPPVYANLLLVPKSLQEAQDRLIACRQEFMSLPSAVRRAFNNSPVEFYDKVTRGDKEAFQVLVKNGLAKVREDDSSSKAKDVQHGESKGKKEAKAEPEPKSGT